MNNKPELIDQRICNEYKIVCFFGIEWLQDWEGEKPPSINGAKCAIILVTSSLVRIWENA